MFVDPLNLSTKRESAHLTISTICIQAKREQGRKIITISQHLMTKSNTISDVHQICHDIDYLRQGPDDILTASEPQVLCNAISISLEYYESLAGAVG